MDLGEPLTRSALGPYQLLTSSSEFHVSMTLLLATLPEYFPGLSPPGQAREPQLTGSFRLGSSKA